MNLGRIVRLLRKVLCIQKKISKVHYGKGIEEFQTCVDNTYTSGYSCIYWLLGINKDVIRQN